MSIVLEITSSLKLSALPFYWGWTALHTDWEPVSYSYAELTSGGTAELAQNYFAQWTSPVLTFAIFGLFGLTSEARASYWRIICAICALFGWRPILRGQKGQASLGEIEFDARQQEQRLSHSDVEMALGCASTIMP